jgi:hypothetical protein
LKNKIIKKKQVAKAKKIATKRKMIKFDRKNPRKKLYFFKQK